MAVTALMRSRSHPRYGPALGITVRTWRVKAEAGIGADAAGWRRRIGRCL